MNSFSISAYEHQPMLDYYKQWLARDLYTNISLEKLDDPTFLQKLSIIQADGIRRDIGAHAAITHSSIQGASTEVGRKIQTAANMITSSLDDGFTLMNQRMMEVNSNLGVIGHGIGEVNNTLQQSNQILSGINSGIAQTNQGIAQLNRGIGVVASGMNALNQNMVSGMNALNHNIVANLTALAANISQAASILNYQLKQAEKVLHAILDELKIPESQRERRYHIEEGMKFFNKGMRSGDCLYFEDALEEFTTATSIERKDFFSWYYIGMIHLYSIDHLDFDKALSAFNRYIHYADAMAQRHNLFDEALMMKAECYYLKQEVNQAYQVVETIVSNNTKAALRGMKYLSASGIVEKQVQAVELLKRLMLQNPYIVMQVLEDYDLISNKYILQFIQEYQEKEKNEALYLETLLIKNMDRIEPWQVIYDLFNKELSALRNKYSHFSVVDAIRMTEMLTLLNEKLNIILPKYNEINKNLELLKQCPILYNEYLNKINTINNKLASKDDFLNNEIINHDLTAFENELSRLISGLKHISTVKDSNNRYGFACNGHVIIPCQWKFAYQFIEGIGDSGLEDCHLAAVQDFNNMWGFIDKSGRVVIQFQWVDAHPFSEGLAVVAAYRKYGNLNKAYSFIDKTGKMAFPNHWWWYANDFKEGLAVVSDGSFKFGFIDKSGRIVIPYKWKFAAGFKEGLAAVQNPDDKWGFIDKSGQLVIPCQWHDTHSFYEGLAIVKDSNNRWGYINKNGLLVIPCQWKKAVGFSNGHTYVWDFKDNKYLIDKTGKIVG